jgi:DNA-binding NarL/FixJ family response regulator
MPVKPELIRSALAAAADRHRMALTALEIEILTDAAARAVLPARRHFPRHPGSPLNTREVQIIAGAARGHTNAQIASSIGLSPLTVKSHLTRIAARVGCGDRAGIVGLAYRKGWLVQLPPEPRPVVQLKPDHLAVLDGMAQGLGNAEIGRRLFLSEEAVKSRARSLFDALGAHTRAHAVALGYQHGHLPLDGRPAETARPRVLQAV